MGGWGVEDYWSEPKLKEELWIMVDCMIYKQEVKRINNGKRVDFTFQESSSCKKKTDKTRDEIER